MSEIRPAAHPRPAYRRLVAASALAAVLAVLLGSVLMRAWDEEPAHPTAPAAMAVASTPTGSPAPSPSMSAVTPSAAVPSPAAKPSPAKPAPRPTRSTTAPKPACSPFGSVSANVPRGGTFTFRVVGMEEKPVRWCPGERRRVLWASYVYDASGVSHLHDSQVGYLTQAQPTLTMTLRTATPDCRVSWYIVAGNASIPRTVPAGGKAFARAIGYKWEDEPDRCH